MFGYISTIESELKVREAASYRSWYCGLCKCMNRNYGFFSPLFLQYDCAFLALLFSGELGEAVDAKRCHCLHRCHDPRRKYRLETPALRFAAAVNVLLAYYKCLDDWRDERDVVKGVGVLLLKGAVRRAGRDYPALQARTEQFYRDQMTMERDDGRLDAAADPTGKYLESLADMLPFPEAEKVPLKWLLYNLGRWIYLMDAWDDREKDQKKGAFNPYLQAGTPKEDAAFGLYASLEEAHKAFDLLSPSRDRGLMENVLTLGCPERTRRVLDKSDKEVGHESL
jgi:hypothetical protein